MSINAKLRMINNFRQDQLDTVSTYVIEQKV